VSRPSEPVLRWLRRQIDVKGENSASIASKLGRPKQEVRKLLEGAAPMLLDDLLAITEILKLSPSDLGLAAELPEVAALDEAEEDDEDDEAPQWGNQPRTLVQLGFDLGIDMLLLLDADALGDQWGGPPAVRKQFATQPLPLKLPAEVHQHMRPEFDDDALGIVLSFDTLYNCRLPWSAFRRVVFDPHPPEPPAPEAPDAGEPVAAAPFLRLIK
jgi:hypothetical protein